MFVWSGRDSARAVTVRLHTMTKRRKSCRSNPRRRFERSHVCNSCTVRRAETRTNIPTIRVLFSDPDLLLHDHDWHMICPYYLSLPENGLYPLKFSRNSASLPIAFAHPTHSPLLDKYRVSSPCFPNPHRCLRPLIVFFDQHPHAIHCNSPTTSSIQFVLLSPMTPFTEFIPARDAA